jgi:hypothetical protein
MSLGINYWAQSLWKIMYTMAYTFAKDATVEKLVALVEFYRSLKELLPCEMCREHYGEYLLKHDIRSFTLETATSEKLCKWVYNLESEISVKNKRPIEPFNIKYAKLGASDPTKGHPVLSNPVPSFIKKPKSKSSGFNVKAPT